MWSLAVEEQYYLAYPFLALVLLRRRVRSVLVPAAAVVAIAWQVFMAGHASVDRVYLGTDTRAAGLLVGAVVAILPVTALVAVGRYGAPVALAGLVVGGVLLDGGDSETFRGPFQLAILAGAVLLLGLRPGTASPVTRLIARRPLIAIGRWSYGIYLFHWPLAELLRQGLGWGDVAVTAVAIPAAIAIAAGSYAVVESPLRRRGLAAFGRPWPTVGACAALACVALVATSVGAREPLVAEDVAAAAAPVAVADAATTGAAPRAVAGVVPRPADRPYRLMLVGDSVGASLVARSRRSRRRSGSSSSPAPRRPAATTASARRAATSSRSRRACGSSRAGARTSSAPARTRCCSSTAAGGGAGSGPAASARSAIR